MNLSERDSKVIWHPYTQMQTAELPVAIVRGEGARLYDEDGKEYIDAISSWWVNVHGHANRYIGQKIHEQLQVLEHVIFAGFTHQPAVELAERLIKVLPQNQSRIFYSDDGSTAVEVAVKMALQYWYNQGINKKTIVAFRNSYHGDTFGAMSVSERDIFTAPFRDLLFDVAFIDAPLKGIERESLDQLERELQKENVAAFIFEPLLQGAGGMIVYEAPPLDELIYFCREKGIPTIADEVLTGFGRTGKFFASDYLKNKPDIICMSKGITGGTMPFGATSCTEKVYEAFLSDDRKKTFFHGHSYTGNPAACAAALASLDLFEKPGTWDNIRRIESSHREFLSRIRNHPIVEKPRQIGTIMAFDAKCGEQTSYLHSLRDRMSHFCLTHGVIIRPLGNIIYFMPPYCITDEELSRVYSTIQAMLLEIDNLK
ncbi:MAG TPA: adenosylmethionine--8-amino-7-oxononanoate transaminase [Candidatus Acidoferrales bacterium]|nr:adenosylmethionine--8-amino-7-oxononanoate transaminase [Candidatus Acidoferrales bacterium]